MKKDTERFSAILKDYVMERRKINPRLSESQIAHNLGISGATFHRIMNGRTYPNVRTLLTLCKSIPKMKTVVTEEMLEVTRESKTGYVGGELENLLSDKDGFIAYALALSDNGVTEKEILYCRGHQGQKALENLTEKGFVKKDKDNIYRATEAKKGVILSFEVIKQHLKVLVENYKPDNVADNYIYYKMESLNKKG